MKYCLLLIGLFCISFSCFPATDSLLNELDKALLKKPEFTRIKLERIEDLKTTLNTKKLSLTEQHDQLLKIFEEYKTLNFDSAYIYENKVQEMARRLNQPSKIVQSKFNICFVLLSSGMFKENFEVLNSVDVTTLNNAEKIELYTLKANSYYNLCDFVDNRHYSTVYNNFGNQFADSAISLSQPGSYNHTFMSGLRNLRLGEFKSATKNYQYLISKADPATNHYAILASTLSYLYSQTGRKTESVDLLIKSVIADIKSSTKENLSMFKLSDTLFRSGDNKRAYRYIQEALADAQYYGAKSRLFAIGTLLPIIEGKQLMLVEKQKNEISRYAAAVTLLTVLVIAFSLIIISQLRKLKLAKTDISEKNTALEHSNRALEDSNMALREANRIKDEYIGYYFNINSEYIDKIERFKRSVSQKIASGRFDEIKQTVNKIDLVKEREELSRSFDRIFIKLFPNFVEAFNSFFSEEDKMELHGGQLLNTELRIFALIRLGIHDNDKIAKILGYSVNTIYSYKTRIKNKSVIPNDEFEDKIMQIRTD